jgi:hypothetical protein
MCVIVIGMITPALHLWRAAAERTRTVNNLDLLGKAVHNHISTYNGKLPRDGKVVTIAEVAQPRSILFQLLPYVAPD